MNIIDNLKNDFEKIFKTPYENIFFSPGRVNLIGEHTDYNGGHVLPCTIEQGIYAAVRKREDKNVNLYSMNFDDLGIFTISLDSITYNENDNWIKYPKGVMWEIISKRIRIKNWI